MEGTTIYSKSTGVEVVGVTRKRTSGDYVNKWGAVRMRFFQMEEDKNSIRVLLNCVESAKLGRVLRKLVDSSKAAKVQIFYHQYETQEGQKVSTTLTAEKWVKGNKSGYALVLVQKNGEETTINVPMDKDTAYYLALLMEHLSVKQSWFSNTKAENQDENTPPKEENTPPEEEKLDDIEF